MSETGDKKQNWAKSLVVISACAIIGAIGGGFFSMLMLMFFWGLYDSSTFGILVGLPVGFFSGGGSSIWLIRKQTQIMKVILVSTCSAILISCILTAIIWNLM